MSPAEFCLIGICLGEDIEALSARFHTCIVICSDFAKIKERGCVAIAQKNPERLLSVAIGEIVYSHGSSPCKGVGLTWTDNELDAALSGPVSSTLFDDVGDADLASILYGLADTDFAHEGVGRILESPQQVEDWRVGEAIAETYLTHNHFCHFPWPDVRDERREGSSLPGADLVGFGSDAEGDCFAFGEVKTSSDQQYPPRVMYGSTGLKNQLEDLNDCKRTRDTLLRYLGHRVESAPWRPKFENAGRRYLQNAADFQLFGILIRDVPPNIRDLRARVDSLNSSLSNGTHIKLLALYLPESCIEGLGISIAARRREVIE